jgi:predicted enzyme related to lactoylglutathione lyase
LNQARAFYADTLGLPVIPEFSDDHFVALQPAGEAQIGITNTPGAANGPSSTELAMEVSDVDHIYREWKTKGVTLLTEPADFPFGRAFDAQDPDGNKLSIYKVRSMN